MKLQHHRAVVIMTCILCAGCVPTTVRPGGPAAQLPADPAAYLNRILEKSRTVSNVSGFAKLRITGEGKSTQSRNIFFVRHPDRIRIETLGFLSRPALLFTADEARMNLYSIENNTFFTGESTAENFSRIIGMRLELPLIVESFLGHPRVQQCADGTTAVRMQENLFLFTRDCSTIQEQFGIDPATQQLRTYAVSENGLPAYRYTYMHYQESEAVLFPLKIDIYHYTYKIAVTLEFESLSFEKIPDERFDIVAPRNAQVHSIEDIGASH